MAKQRDEFQYAKELGKALASSEELKRLRNAQAELELDKEAAKLYKELKTGIVPADEETIKGSPVVAELVSAEEGFKGLLKTINGIIGFYVTGEEKIEIGDSGYSGCSGCGMSP
ncbi:MAG: YlbF family regulator [Clostridia bacterium]|jgi:cell fate (sporulation/competence/biofilm development) regulator YlbF (YheA/YmcA/DUF963 family)